MGKKKQGYDSRAVANHFVELAAEKGERLTIMQVVKLVYLAHGWFLGFYPKTPLISHDVEAWRLGPVVREVYKAFRPQGVIMSRHAIDGKKPYRADFSEDALEIIDSVFEEYTNISVFALSAITHKPGTPWSVIYERDGLFAPIPDELIGEYYQQRIAAQQNNAA